MSLIISLCNEICSNYLRLVWSMGYVWNVGVTLGIIEYQPQPRRNASSLLHTIEWNPPVMSGSRVFLLQQLDMKS